MIQYGPYFIIGCGRSGTHYLASILDTSEKIHVTYEDPAIFPHVVDSVTKSPDCLDNAIEQYRKLMQEHTIYVDKSHPNLFNVDRLLHEFPNARFIGIYRDAFQTITSMIAHGCANWGNRYSELMFPNAFLGLTETNYDEYAAASLAERCLCRWESHFDELQKVVNKYSDRVLVVSYAQLVNDPQRQVQRLSNFVGADLTVVHPIREAIHKWKKTLTEFNYEQICALKASHTPRNYIYVRKEML